MVFLKTTNNVVDETVERIIRTVQCPYCKTHLQGISKEVLSMVCWHCKKPFRIQRDKSKFVETPKQRRTIIGRL